MIDTEAAAVACAVTPATIRQWAARGFLTPHGTARRRLWDLSDLLQAKQRATRTERRVLASRRRDCHAAPATVGVL